MIIITFLVLSITGCSGGGGGSSYVPEEEASSTVEPVVLPASFRDIPIPAAPSAPVPDEPIPANTIP